MAAETNNGVKNENTKNISFSLHRMRRDGFRTGKGRVEMHRTSRDNAICAENLEEAMAASPEAYGRLDLIAFGFPCQDISQANPQGKGLAGKRSGVFFECMRIVQLLRPRWILIENVPRLLTINQGRDMAVVLHALAESGYGWAYRILDSQDFGLPQRRKRLFIVGRFGGVPAPQILFQQEGDCRDFTKVNAIQSAGGDLFAAEKSETADSCSCGKSGNEKRRIVSKTLNTSRRGASYVWREDYIAEIDGGGKRETARVSNGMDSGRFCVIGNAVSVPVAEWIGKRIMMFGDK